MTSNFARRFWKISRWFIAFFLCLFCFRLLYGYIVTDSGGGRSTSDYFSGIDGLRKNYASERRETKALIDGGDGAAAMAPNSQKYEKTATVTAKTTDFEKDDRQVRAKVEASKAVIQYENAFGLKGARELHLLVGVTPGEFDSFYLAMQKIGTVRAMSVIKEDKTNEYRQLNAQKASLQKTLESLVDLKSKGGNVSDFVVLHDKILDIESRLQDLGVQLGNFNTENEFCTVRFSLYEGAPKQGVSFIHRVRVALEWSIQYFVMGTIGFFAVIAAVFVLILAFDKLKAMGLINRE